MFIKAKHNIYGKEEYCYINTRYIVQAYPPNQWSNLWLVFYTEKIYVWMLKMKNLKKC